MKGIDFYKKVWHFVTIIILSILVWLTIDIIRETKEYVLFDIDFEVKYNSIAAYGALVGGLLSFLSILFVMYQLLEQRTQIIKEKQEKELESKEELFDILILLKTFMKSSLKI
jgi:large-conductance mechanosensitive channel